MLPVQIQGTFGELLRYEGILKNTHNNNLMFQITVCATHCDRCFTCTNSNLDENPEKIDIIDVFQMRKLIWLKRLKS